MRNSVRAGRLRACIWCACSASPPNTSIYSRLALARAQPRLRRAARLHCRQRRCLIPRLFSQARIVLNVDGWTGSAASGARSLALHPLVGLPGETRFAYVVVADLRRVQAYYRQAYGADPIVFTGY